MHGLRQRLLTVHGYSDAAGVQRAWSGEPTGTSWPGFRPLTCAAVQS
jgi:hypothetical protein